MNTVICVPKHDSSQGTRELRTQGHAHSHTVTMSKGNSMLTSFPKFKPLTPGCFDCKYVSLLHRECGAMSKASCSPECELNYQKINCDMLINASKCGSQGYGNNHFLKKQRLSCIHCRNRKKGKDNFLTNQPLVGKTDFRGRWEGKVKGRVSCSRILSGGRSPRGSKDRSRCETWVGFTAAVCLVALGLVYLQMRITVLENEMIQLEHFKSRVNMLEHLVNRMSEANNEHRKQTEFKSTTNSPMHMTFPEEHQLRSVLTGTTKQPEPQGGGLLRAKRDADKQKNGQMKGLMKSALDGYCNTKCSEITGQLDYVQFQAVFDSSALDKHDSNVGPNKVLSGTVIVGKGNILQYINQGSLLDIYKTRVHPTVDNSTVLVENNNFPPSFTVKTTGIYAIHVNITILDEQEKHTREHYIGLYLNDQVVLACLNGGFRCSSNLKDSQRIRVCNINGILSLKDSDKIQLKTMEANTTIWILTSRNSVFTMVLLHKS